MHKILSVIPSEIVNLKKDFWKEAIKAFQKKSIEGIILKYFYGNKEITCMITKVGEFYNSGVYINGEVFSLDIKLPLEEVFFNSRINVAQILRGLRNGSFTF